MKTKQTKVSVLFMLFSILFTVCLITANLLGAKQIALGPISLTGGILIFPISYIINDCVCEVWGYSKVRLLIWTGFLMDFFFVAVCGLCDISQVHHIGTMMLGFINAYVMSKMKLKSKGKHFSVRAILSTILGEGADSLIFFPIAFMGVIPTSELPLLMFWQVVIKTSYEIVVLPITIQVVNWVKKHEEEDAYDEGIDYDILKIFTI